MLVAERLSPPLQVLAEERLRAFQVALGVQQRAEVADRAERARVTGAGRRSQTISPEERQFELMRGRKLEGGWR